MKSELEKENIKRLSNVESNILTKKCLKKALLNILLKKSFEDITITEITKRAGVSRVSFYRNYDSKESLLSELYKESGKKLKNAFSIKRFDGDKYKMFFNFFSYIKNNPTKIYCSHNFHNLFKNLFIDEVFIANNINEEYEIALFSGALNSLVKKWLESDFSESIEFMADFCAKNFDYDWLK